jgi:hypothetical protein
MLAVFKVARLLVLMFPKFAHELKECLCRLRLFSSCQHRQCSVYGLKFEAAMPIVMFIILAPTYITMGRGSVNTCSQTRSSDILSDLKKGANDEYHCAFFLIYWRRQTCIAFFIYLS